MLSKARHQWKSTTRNCFPMGPFVAQSLAALIATLPMLCTGMVVGWASFSLPKLLHQSSTEYGEDELRITPDEGSWVVNLTGIGAIFGPIILNLLVDRIGRKWALNLLVLPILISWLFIGLATSVEMLYIGRFIGGLSFGASFALLPMYLGEIAEKRIRGALGTLMTTVLGLGMLMSFCIGPWITRGMFSIVGAIPAVIFLVLFLWIPETPYFLLMKGDREKAMASLVWLRRRSDVSNELSTLQDIVNKEQKNRDGFGIANIFRSSSNRKAFAISIGILTLQQFSGFGAILAYSSLIFESSGLTGWSSRSVIITGVIMLLAGISVTFLIDVAGRRPILILSTIFSMIFLITEAVFFHLKNLGYDTSSFSWIPLLGLVGFYIFYVPGLASIPYIIIGELFPTNVKAPATMMLSMYGSAMGAIVTKIYQSTSDDFGIQWAFYFFCIATFAGAFFVYFCVPETKRLSLENIQENLKSRRSVGSKFPVEHDFDQTDMSKS